MLRVTGQAARHVVRVLHWLLAFAFLATVVTASGAAMLAWRLSQGPLGSPWLAGRLEAVANAGGGPTRLVIGSAAIAWEGFRQGVDMPLDIRLSGIAATDTAGVKIADIPRAEVSLSPGALLAGRLRPRGVEIDRARLRLVRADDGSISVDVGSLAEADDTLSPDSPAPAGPGLLPGLLTELARPAGNDRGEMRNSLVADLQHLRVRDAMLVVVDRQLGATWRVPKLDVELARLKQGGLEGNGDAQLALGDQRTTLHMTATFAPGSRRTEVAASFGPVEPAALARAARAFAPLSGLEAPVSVSLKADLGPLLALRSVSLEATAGPGQAHVGAATVQIANAMLSAEGTANELTLRKLTLDLSARAGGTLSKLQAHGQGRRTGDMLKGGLTLDFDQVAFTDLSVLWPEGTGTGARNWVTQNITSGMARDGHVEAQLQCNVDLSDVTLVGATGSIVGEGLTIHWLRPIPPIDHAQAKLRIIDPDTIEIVADGGEQQQMEKSLGDPLTIRNGTIKVSGIDHPHQIGTINADLAGGLAGTIALLRQPRLRLLDKHPIPGRDPSGQASIKLDVQLPLEEKVKIEDIAIHAQAHLTDAHLSDLVAGHDLDQGALDVDATNEGLKIGGDALLAGIASQFALEMDFRSGPPSQILQTVTVSGRASRQQLTAAGVDIRSAMSGTADLRAVLMERRDGRGIVQADADLAGADLTVSPILWRKPAGAPAQLSARIILDHDRMAGIEGLSLEGKDVSVHGQADYAGGRVAVLRFDRVVLGRTQAAGMVRFPQPDGKALIEATFNGPVIDLSMLTAHRSQPSAPKPTGEQPPGPAWTLQARFDRAIMAGGRSWLGLAAKAENDGRLFARVSIDGQTTPGQAFRLEIAPSDTGRSLTASAADAGTLLAGVDLVGTMQGGRLALAGTYDDRRADHALSGTADITDFRVRDPNGLGRLLQAMTLYGLVQAASGPGLGFTRLTAPFVLTDDSLELGESRAFNPSLGLTAKGRVDLRRNVADIQGTIVPAYFFNSLLGNVPLIGRLFSPEAGGGVFAASYTVRGPLDDPKIAVNPLSTLTPGFLRGVFGLF